MAKENSRPTRLLAGQGTLLSRTMHDIRYDEGNDEIFLTNPFAEAILVFRGAAQGEERPLRVIQGPSTQLSGLTDRLDVDTVHNEIFVPDGDKILVYPRSASGDVAPIRVIQGPHTQLESAESAAVDPIHNLLVVGTNTGYRKEGQAGALLIFNRTDEGDVKPRAVIQGPKSGIIRITQIQIYGPKGWIIATQPGRGNEEEPKGAFVGVWSIEDNGDVPPRWKIGGPKSLIKKPRGVALDVKHQELIIADMRLNAVLTYLFPEIF